MSWRGRAFFDAVADGIGADRPLIEGSAACDGLRVAVVLFVDAREGEEVKDMGIDKVTHIEGGFPALREAGAPLEP